MHYTTPHYYYTTLYHITPRLTLSHYITPHYSTPQDSKAAQKTESKLQVTTQGYLVRAQKLQDAVLAAFDTLGTVQRDHGTYVRKHTLSLLLTLFFLTVDQMKSNQIEPNEFSLLKKLY